MHHNFPFISLSKRQCILSAEMARELFLWICRLIDARLEISLKLQVKREKSDRFWILHLCQLMAMYLNHNWDLVMNWS